MKKRIESAESLPPPAPLASDDDFLQMNGDAPKGTSLRKILLTGAVFFLGCLGGFVWLSHSINGGEGKIPGGSDGDGPNEAYVHQTFNAIRFAVSKKPNVAKMNSESNFYKTYFMEEESSTLPKSTLEEMKRSFGITPSHRKTLKSGYGNCCYWFWVDNRENPKRLCIIAEPLNGDEKEWRYYLGGYKRPTTPMMSRDYDKLSEPDVEKVQNWLLQDPIDESQFFTLKETIGPDDTIIIPPELKERLKKTMAAITAESKSKGWNTPSQEWIRTQWEKYGGKTSDRVKFVHDGDWTLVVEREGNVFDATFQYEYQDTTLKVLTPLISEKSRKREFDDIKDDGYGGNKLVPPPPNPNPITKEEFLRVFGVVQTTIREKFPDEVPSSVVLKDALAQAYKDDSVLATKILATKIQAYNWMILEDQNGNRQVLLCWKEGETAPTFYLNVADPVEDAKPLSEESWRKRCKEFGLEADERPDKLGTNLPTDLKWRPIRDTDDGGGQGDPKDDRNTTPKNDNRTVTKDVASTDAGDGSGQDAPKDDNNTTPKNDNRTVTTEVAAANEALVTSDKTGGEIKPSLLPITKEEFLRVFGVVQTTIREKFPDEVPSSVVLKDALLAQAYKDDSVLATKIQAYTWMILEDQNGNRQVLLCWKEGETAPTFYLNVADPVEDAKPLSEESWRKRCKEFGLEADERPDKLGTNLPTDLKWRPIRDTDDGGGQGDPKDDRNTTPKNDNRTVTKEVAAANEALVTSDKTGGEIKPSLLPITKEEFLRVFGVVQTTIREKFPDEVPSSVVLKDALAQAYEDDSVLAAKIRVYDWMILEDKSGNRQILLCWKKGETAPTFYLNVADPVEDARPSSKETWLKRCKKFGFEVGERPHGLGEATPSGLQWQSINAVD